MNSWTPKGNWASNHENNPKPGVWRETGLFHSAKKEQLYMKILRGCVATIVLNLMFFTGSVLASTTVENFDIKGIKLGMSVEDVKSVFPQMSIEQISPGEVGMAEILTKYFLHSGMMQASIVKEKYGSGTFSVSYTEFVKKVDPSMFLTGFKNDLVAKYGKPQYENLDRGQNYFACWGDGCNQHLNNDNLRKVDNQYLYVYKGIIKPGKYLMVHFINDNITPRVELSLFDTTPYVNYLHEGEKKKSHDSKTIIKF
jgi:hypothetical protein